MTLETLQHKTLTYLAPLKKYLQQEYQDRLKQVMLFGSQARGEATSASDIDILIVLKDPVDISLELQHTSHFVAQFCLEHNLLVSRFFLPCSRFETENSPFLRNIRREGIVL
ncbi:MAG: nucleotidyltransferase domain-containing protein [Oscillatoriales cyanobacterium RM2_1_1]|nr:nucleotidyltransferase domain-containing protein [Oscillatoriales cyanobacterium SM2_3_0]NJO46375.1 nucleotidyltransferase domain-containing protein [Oscillatoriales cyanobacterium RM2_1_1]